MLTLINRKSTIKIIALLIAIFNILAINVFAIVEPTRDFYVNDYANILSSQTEQYIISKNVQLNEKTGAQIVVVTVESLEGYSLEDYATTLFRKFGIGDRQKNNGVLLLLALNERKFRIEVGYGLEGALTDGKTGRIQDTYIIPYLKENRWNEGVKSGFDAVLQVVANEYNVDIGLDEKLTSYQEGDESLEEIINIFNEKFFWVSVVSSAIFSTILFNKILPNKVAKEWKKIIIGIKYIAIYLLIIGIIMYIISNSFKKALMFTFLNLLMIGLCRS